MAFYVPKSEIQQIPNYENNYRMTPKRLFNGNLASRMDACRTGLWTICNLAILETKSRRGDLYKSLFNEILFQWKMFAQRLRKQWICSFQNIIFEVMLYNQFKQCVITWRKSLNVSNSIAIATLYQEHFKITAFWMSKSHKILNISFGGHQIGHQIEILYLKVVTYIYRLHNFSPTSI